MLRKIYDTFHPDLKAELVNGFTGDTIATYQYPDDNQIIYSEGYFFLKIESTEKYLIVNVTAGPDTAQVDIYDVPESISILGSAHLDWGCDVMESCTSDCADAFDIYYKHEDWTTVYNVYEANDNTDEFVDFGTETTTHYQDQNGVDFFTKVGSVYSVNESDWTQAVNIVNGSLTASLDYTSTNGFTVGYWVKDSATFTGDCFAISFEDTTLTYSITDGDTVLTATRDLSFTLLEYNLVMFTTDNHFVNIYVNDNMIFNVDISDLLLPLVIQDFTMTGNIITHFFTEERYLPLTEASDYAYTDKEIFMTTVLNYEAMLPLVNITEDIPLRNLCFIVRSRGVRTSLSFEKYIYANQFTVRKGSWCYMWDYIPDNMGMALLFYQQNKDMTDQIYSYSKIVVPNGSGYFGTYLPVGSVYTLKVEENNKKIRFIVPNKDRERITDATGNNAGVC